MTAPLAPLLLLSLLPAASTAAQEPSAGSGAAELLTALRLAPREAEEQLALALHHAMTGTCAAVEARIACIETDDEALAARVEVERARFTTWVRLRDEFLSGVAAAGETVTLELAGKRVKTTLTREGDEYVLERGPVERARACAFTPESVVAAIPKERFDGELEWLKIYPYCVTGNVKWKRLTTRRPEADALKADAEETYPELWALGEKVVLLHELAEAEPPADAAGARALLERVRILLASDLACVEARRERLADLARSLLVTVADSLGVAELCAARVSEPEPGVHRLAYDFSDAAQAADWARDDGYLSELRRQLPPVAAATGEDAFAPGADGLAGNGERVWRHLLEFRAPVTVRYQVRWEPIAGQPEQVFSFAVGMVGDAMGRHARVNELGFLYVDELDGPYQAIRPSGDATVQLGRTYALELAHDGGRIRASVDDTVRAEAEPGRLDVGRVFLWIHSDLLISVASLEIEGRVTPESLAAARAAWVTAGLAELGLDDG